MTPAPAPVPNAPLIRKVWDTVLEERERNARSRSRSRWQQSSWRCVLDGTLYNRLREEGAVSAEEAVQRCGTAMCVAGWAVELSPDAEARWASDNPLDDTFDGVLMPGLGEPVTAGYAGRRLLGLGRVRSDCLFASDNDIHQVHRILSDVLGEELTPLPETP